MVKLVKFGHLHLVYHFTVPLSHCWRANEKLKRRAKETKARWKLILVNFTFLQISNSYILLILVKHFYAGKIYFYSILFKLTWALGHRLSFFWYVVVIAWCQVQYGTYFQVSHILQLISRAFRQVK